MRTPEDAPGSMDFCFITSQFCFPLTGSAPTMTALILMIRGLLLMFLFLRLQNLCFSQSPLFSCRFSSFSMKGVFLTRVKGGRTEELTSVQKTIHIMSSRLWFKITTEVDQQSGEEWRGRPGVRFREWVFKPRGSNLTSELPNSEMSKRF